MKVGRWWLSVLLLAAGAGGFWAMGTATVRTRPSIPEQAPVVETVEAPAHTEGIEFEIDGLVVPFRQIAVATEVSGRVAYKAEAFRTGRAVKQGELLLKIDQRDYQLEVTRLQEELKQAGAMVDEMKLEIENINNQVDLAKRQLDIDKRELERNENLGASGALSESEVDKVRRAELATRNSYQSLFDQKNLLNRRQVRLESAMDLVQAQLDRAQLALTRTEIYAPLDGVVVSENVEQDGYVQMGSTVMTLQDTSRLDVACKLHMRQMHWLWQSRTESPPSDQAVETWRAYDFPETPATVYYRIGAAQYQWQGVLNRYDGAGVDDQTRMIPCRVHVTDPLAVEATTSSLSWSSTPPTLMTGMFVKVRVNAPVTIPLVRVPQEAIQPGNIVWSVDDKKLEKHAVRIAYSSRESILVYAEPEGLQAGDIVVVSPLAIPVEGTAVVAIPFGTEPPRVQTGGPPAGRGGGRGRPGAKS